MRRGRSLVLLIASENALASLPDSCKINIMAERPNSSLAQTHWTAFGRWAVFLLASSSIACLLFDFYHLCPMRVFTLLIFIPAMLLLAGMAVFYFLRGHQQLSQAGLIGLAGGLIAGVSLHVFRLPFLFAKQSGISSLVPPMALV